MTKRLPSAVVERAVAGSSLEWKLTDVNAFALTTATPLQRAVCRVADGVPLGDLAAHPHVIAAIGDVHGLPHERPKEVLVISGIRAAKSLIAACGAFHMAVTCDVSSLRPGESPRVSIVSLAKDNAEVIMGHLVGGLNAKPLLKRFMLGDPSGDSVWIRHPTGMPIEIRVVAGSRAGGTLVSRWSAGCIFDEFPRMSGADDAVVNWDDSREAVLGRVLNGCQLWHVGSPKAPYGPAYEVVTDNEGKPTRDLVVIRAPGHHMNPYYWTPERMADMKAREPDTFKTDVMAEFASPAEALFSSEAVNRCTRKAPEVIGPKLGNTYYAAMDPATRGNGWTLAIATREGGKTIVVRADEWQGSRDEPLDPGEVITEIAGILAAYGVFEIDTDQAMGDALVKLGRQAGLTLRPCTLNANIRARKYLAIRTRLDSGELELPPVPKLRTDLLHLRRRVTPGGMTIDLPMTSDGRHCDYAPALMLVLSRLLPEAEPVVEIRKRGEDPETKRLRAELMERIRGKKDAW